MASELDSGLEGHPNDKSESFRTRHITSKTFQFLLVISLVRLGIFLNKLYQDFNAVSTYYTDRDIYFSVVSIFSLALPPLVYAVYLAGQALVRELEVSKTELGTRTLNGLLFIPWQIKRHLDVLYYAAQRGCHCRSPEKQEKHEIETMEREAETLEFFEDFYAGFLQILLQVYIAISVVQWNWQTPSLTGEVVGSCLSVLSMMVALRRRDDGPLTTVLSFVGWLSIIVSRIIVFSLIGSFIHQWLIVLLLGHAMAMTGWVYRIATEEGETDESHQDLVKYTTRQQKFFHWILVFCFFGAPSLFYWPIMFQLKENKRPAIFLAIIVLENVVLLCLFLLIAAYVPSKSFEGIIGGLMVTVVLSTVLGVMAISSYVYCKPSLTDQVVLVHGEGVQNKSSYGFYYEFCDIVFKLPSTVQVRQGLKEIGVDC